MALFQLEHHTASDRHRRIYAAYELAYTLVDFLAAMLFLVGSVLFFFPSLEKPAIWCFVVGSACFALKPSLRLARELHYLRIGDTEDLAERYSSVP
ncbi:MAG: YrhK family protein [Arenibacter algicola]|nr:YrhK family protein [Arenibacter algicola]